MFVHSQHQLHQHQYQHQHPPMDDITGGNWGSNYKSGATCTLICLLTFLEIEEDRRCRRRGCMLYTHLLEEYECVRLGLV